MPSADLIIAPRWVIPVEPAGAVLEEHALVVGDGTIVEVAPRDEAVARHPAATVVERPRHALIPGLINAHTHASMTLFRGLADDMPLETWLGEHIWPAESRWASADFVRDGTELALLEMIRGGTTCFNDMYFFPDVVAGLAAGYGVRASVGMIVIEMETVWARDVEDYLAKGLKVHDQYREHPLITTAFAPHAPYSVPADALERIRTLADELETPIHMHVHETANEVEQELTDEGRRPLERLDNMGLLSPLLVAVHMTQLTDDEIALLAERGVSVVHCPESNMKLASGHCPVPALVQAGVNVALGTDGAGSNNDLDMLGEIRSAALLAKSVTGDAAALPAAEALAMATINGARALGIDDRVGSLTAGKSADAVCIDLDHPSTQPVYHPISQLVYAASRDQITDVWVAGNGLLTEGQYTAANAADVFERVGGWQQRMREDG